MSLITSRRAATDMRRKVGHDFRKCLSLQMRHLGTLEIELKKVKFAKYVNGFDAGNNYVQGSMQSFTKGRVNIPFWVRISAART